VSDDTAKLQGSLFARFFALGPYALAAVWSGMAPTQALMLALLLELLSPAGTQPLRMAVRHFVLWGVLLLLLPDPFAWWLAPAWCLLLVGTHRWWSQSSRLAGLLAAILLLPALLDVIARLDPSHAVTSAGVRNPWVAQPGHENYGARLELAGMGIVIPASAEPLALQASAKERARALGFLAVSMLLLLALSRRRHPAANLVGLLPLVLAYALFRPAQNQSLWLQVQEDGDWQVLTFSWPLEVEEGSGKLIYEQRAPVAGDLWPTAAVATVERGPLLAPKESGEEGILSLLRHWADARIDPGESFGTENVPSATKSSWEIDSRGVLVLRALP